MTTEELITYRLHNHQLAIHTLSTSKQVVAHLGAVQSQDYAGAKWAVGQRLTDASDQVIEKAFTDGNILRTHVLRPTWHFVTPEDISWMLTLTGPNISKAMSSYNKTLELTPEIFTKAEKLIVKLLEEKKQVIRHEIKEVFAKEGIPTNVQRLAHLVMQAEIDQIICSGPRRGKQFTYMLFSDRVPPTPHKTREEALAELAKRYFASHGPATMKDFVWWSGLTVADAKLGVSLQTDIEKTLVDDKEYYFFPKKLGTIPDEVFLLPNYDEYTVSYKDRDAYFDQTHASFFDNREGVAFWNMIIYQGKGIASWRKEEKKNHLEIQYKAFSTLPSHVLKSIEQATNTYSSFLKKPIKIID